MNMFARFDENPAMTLRVIKETKRYGRTDGCTDTRTDGQRENSIPPTNKVCGGYKNVCLFGLHKYRDKQCGPRSDYSHRSSLIWIYTVFGRGFKYFSKRQKYTTFFVICALRVVRIFMKCTHVCVNQTTY